MIQGMTRRKELETLLLASLDALTDPGRPWDQPDDGLPTPETRNPDPKEKVSVRRTSNSSTAI